MDLHLAEVAKDVAPGRHAVLFLDQATSARRLIISSVIGGSSVRVGVSQPDPTGESPVTTASRSLATALSKARFASGLLPPSYTTSGDTIKFPT